MIVVTDDDSVGSGATQSDTIYFTLTVPADGIFPYWQNPVEKKVYVEVGSEADIHLGDYSAENMHLVDNIIEEIARPMATDNIPRFMDVSKNPLSLNVNPTNTDQRGKYKFMITVEF
jgi:hypothetical protein